MKAVDLYETEGFEGSVDPSSETRKFQVSVIIKQDTNRSGVLSFLEQVEESSVALPTSSPSQTTRPTTSTESTYNV